MAGYMGFGMQYWLYKKRPRKTFAKRKRIQSFSSLDKYSRAFKVRPHIKENEPLVGAISLLLAMVLLFFATFCSGQFVDYSKAHYDKQAKSMGLANDKAFNFLINSGKSRLLSNDISGAYSEFNLAYKLKPDSYELHELLVETLSILCAKNIAYCVKMDHYLKTMPNGCLP
ncbi:hypothetical protein [Snuella lapsa]|uniref:Tetratricopeptide repeat protein n=1 Tax=Snuella lapsa TaxID=870481 RepID=A0ABP6YI47_9FLAO